MTLEDCFEGASCTPDCSATNSESLEGRSRFWKERLVQLIKRKINRELQKGIVRAAKRSLL